MVLIGFLLIVFSFGVLRFESSEFHYQKEVVNSLAQRIELTINKTLPEPQSSLLAGLLLGIRREMPASLLEDFSRTGTTHIIALSGYNITIVASVLMAFFGFLTIPRRHSFWLAIIGIVFFVWLAGFQVSLIRAAIMGVLVLVAIRSGRLYSVTNALVFAGALMVLWDPFILLHNVSFQLSFLATMGIIYLFPFFKRFGEILGMTLAAQFMVLPLIGYYFSEFSLISPLANILILPVIPVTMLFGFFSTLAGFLWVPLAQILSIPAWLLLTYQIKVVEILSRVPFASLELPQFHWLWLVFLYVIILLWILRKRGCSWLGLERLRSWLGLLRRT